GRPPIPRARSSASEPVETAPTETCGRSLIRMTEPLPNARSICPSAASSACSRSTIQPPTVLKSTKPNCMKDNVLPSRPTEPGMVDRGAGRTEPPEAGKLGGEPRPLAEPDDGEVWQPRPLLGLVHAEPVQTLVKPVGDLLRRPTVVVEDEHSDAARLAVAPLAEDDRPRAGRGRLQLRPDRLDVACRP